MTHLINTIDGRGLNDNACCEFLAKKRRYYCICYSFHNIAFNQLARRSALVLKMEVPAVARHLKREWLIVLQMETISSSQAWLAKAGVHLV